MSEYIPTTGVIRAAYQIARDTEGNLVSFREFHSWLEKHDAEITAQAEARIIKLLESKLAGMDNGLAYCYECGYWDDLLPDVIALINVENKASHTHEIEVFGAPCDCGTRHEYCGECSLVEPCETEGEQK